MSETNPPINCNVIEHSPIHDLRNDYEIVNDRDNTHIVHIDFDDIKDRDSDDILLHACDQGWSSNPA